MNLLPRELKLDTIRTLGEEITEVYTMTNVMKNDMKRGISIHYVRASGKRCLKWFGFFSVIS